MKILLLSIVTLKNNEKQKIEKEIIKSREEKTYLFFYSKLSFSDNKKRKIEIDLQKLKLYQLSNFWINMI